MASVYLLTGRPGTGKTTVIRQAIAGAEIKVGGFYTEDIRNDDDGTRQGFSITALNGQNATLAHVDNRSRYRVGKYGVDITALNDVGVAAVERALEESDLIVIDEIGRMELLSPRFREAVLKAVDSGKKVLATILLNPHPFTDEVKRHPNAKVVELTRANRDVVLTEILGWIRS